MPQAPTHLSLAARAGEAAQTSARAVESPGWRKWRRLGNWSRSRSSRRVLWKPRVGEGGGGGKGGGGAGAGGAPGGWAGWGGRWGGATREPKGETGAPPPPAPPLLCDVPIVLSPPSLNRALHLRRRC